MSLNRIGSPRRTRQWPDTFEEGCPYGRRLVAATLILVATGLVASGDRGHLDVAAPADQPDRSGVARENLGADHAALAPGPLTSRS